EVGSIPTEVFAHETVCYPSIGRLTEDFHSPYTFMANKALFDAPLDADAPPLYPTLANLHYEKDKHGLLTEQNLLAFYQNPLYMMSDQFVEKFVQVVDNLTPSGPIFPLLKRLKQLAELMSINEISVNENRKNLTKCLCDCWIVEQHTVESKGRCGENKEAHGMAHFLKTTLRPEKVDELNNLLSASRTHLLDERLCLEAQFRSTALQVQWFVIFINQRFMEENRLSAHSPPNLLENAVNSNGRVLLLGALSDLFFHLRFPVLPKRVTDVLISWVQELVCVLYMCCRCEDAQFVLNHLLRLPSPIVDWAPPLVQTFIQAPSHPKVKLDHCITMLSHLLNPITARDSFLRQIGLSEAEDSTWTILSDDDEEGDFSLITINECDLTSLFEQLPISELYSLAYLSFSNSEKGDLFAALIAFQLLLMKVLDTGLSTYCSPTYKLFCKQIGNGDVPFVKRYCMVCSERWIVFGLWQFLVDLPFDCVTDDCRSRCEYVLRSVEKITVSELYDIPLSELVARNRRGGLKERAEAIGPLDSVFLVNTLAAIVSHSHSGPVSFVKEIVEICFCDESSRKSLYKVGGEAVALLLSRKPNIFDQLLIVLDRNMSHMDNYAIDVLTSSDLCECKLSPASLSILGKWLIYKPPDDAANRMARRILSSVYWGMNEAGDQLWLHPSVHEISADTVMKAHSMHCGSSNGMIAKSIRQVSKLASRMADHEQLFNQFCWDILIKLKISSKVDLTAFFIHICQSCLER
uniref:Ectopic P granules protein 5 n=1 Tax=Angiostrongylus cantonensis TaxID=6313 RepID=A0A0K0CZA5_ANGCA